MDVENRYVTFGDQLKQKVQEKKPGYIAAKEGIRWALDAAGNTGQYIKYVNMKIDRHQQEINHIKNLHKKFDREIQLLQSESLEKINLNKNKNALVDVNIITSSLNQLLLGKRNTKTKLRTLESELAIAEKELDLQERQIEDVRENLKKTNYEVDNRYQKNNELLLLKVIKQELENLSKDNDISKLSNAIDDLTSSLE